MGHPNSDTWPHQSWGVSAPILWPANMAGLRLGATIHRVHLKTKLHWSSLVGYSSDKLLPYQSGVDQRRLSTMQEVCWSMILPLVSMVSLPIAHTIGAWPLLSVPGGNHTKNLVKVKLQSMDSFGHVPGITSLLQHSMFPLLSMTKQVKMKL